MTKPSPKPAGTSTLRQRAAQARDAAGRFIRRTATVSAAPPPEAPPSSREPATEPHGIVQAPADAAPGTYGLTVDAGGAGLRCPPGSIAIVEPLRPTGAGLVVLYRKGGGPEIWDLTHNFYPDLFEPLHPESTVAPLVEVIAPTTGRRGYVEAADFEKAHRVIGIHVPAEVAARHRPLPPDVPGMTEPPPGMVVHVVTDAAAYPLVRPGEQVVVDPARRDPEHGGLFLLQWSNGSRSVLLTNHRAAGVTNPPAWWVDPVNRPSNREMLDRRPASGPRLLYASDGPYETDHLRGKIVGAVIGILVPEGRSGAVLLRLPSPSSAVVESASEAGV